MPACIPGGLVNSICNKIRNEMCKLLREEQWSVVTQCKQNPNAYWKYINSKQKSKIGIGFGGINSVDERGNHVVVSNNMEKAEVLGNFFSSVFITEQELSNTAIPHIPFHSPGEQLSFNEQLILDKLHNLNIAKVSRTRWYSSTSIVWTAIWITRTIKHTVWIII